MNQTMNEQTLIDNMFSLKGKETAKVKMDEKLEQNEQTSEGVPNSCDDVENLKLTTTMFLQSLDAESSHEEEQKAIEISSQGEDDQLNVSKRYARAAARWEKAGQR